MTDPLDVLRHKGGSTEPDPAFRDALMARVRAALSIEAVVDGSQAAGGDRDDPKDAPDDDERTELEITMDTHPQGRHHRRRILVAAVGVAAALVIALVLVIRVGDDSLDPAGPGPSATATHTTPSTVVPTSTATPSTTTGPALSDVEIAESAFLTDDEVGDGFRPVLVGDAFTLDGETAAEVPECAAFLDTVFESTARPATVATQVYSKVGATFEQYVVVFPTVDGAAAMMSATADPSFPACWAPFLSATYSKTQTCCTDFSYQPSQAHSLASVGDDMVNLALEGTFTYNGDTLFDEGPTPFVRVGRAVMMFNPPSLPIAPAEGYPDAQFDAALAISVERLRTTPGL